MEDTAKLSQREPLSVLVKMDVEGGEWEVLESMTDDEHSKILLFDLEIHWCRGFDLYSKTHIKDQLERAIERRRRVFRILARLKRYYIVTGREMSRGQDYAYLEIGGRDLTWEDIGCDTKKHYDMMSISLVNKQFLLELEKVQAPKK
jgi:hypothetical protein